MILKGENEENDFMDRFFQNFIVLLLQNNLFWDTRLMKSVLINQKYLINLALNSIIQFIALLKKSWRNDCSTENASFTE